MPPEPGSNSLANMPANMPGAAAPAAPEPVTVVTGGSEGLGLAIAERFAAKGHRILLVARRAELLEAAAETIRRDHGGRVDTLAVDVAAPLAAGTIKAAVAGAGGTVDILVNSAGMGLSGALHDLDPAAIDQLLALNIAALTRLMRHFLPGMQARGRGGILNVASLGGYVPGPYQAAYYASKAYVIALSEAVAAEVAGSGVRVSVVVPGPVATQFHAKMGAEQSLYRWLLPAPRASTIARWAVTGYSFRARTVVPGLFNCLMFAGLRILPHRLVIPLVGWLLKPRRWETRNA